MCSSVGKCKFLLSFVLVLSAVSSVRLDEFKMHLLGLSMIC